MKFGYAITYVKDVTQTVAFWKAAFGIETRFVVPTGDYAELETGHTAIAFAAHELGRSNLPQGMRLPMGPRCRRGKSWPW